MLVKIPECQSRIRNAVIINVYSWVDYFVLSFLFENRNYLHIMTVFKEENKDKRISQE